MKSCELTNCYTKVHNAEAMLVMQRHDTVELHNIQKHHNYPQTLPKALHSLMSLLDINLSRSRRNSLGNHDAEDAVLQARFDCFLVDSRGKAEGTLELADGAFRDPVSG